MKDDCFTVLCWFLPNINMNQPQPSYSFFFFFADDLLLAVYFMFILDYGDDVRQKHIRVIFLSGFKMDCKAVETTRNINNALGPGTANECAVPWWFQFCKGDKSLEGEEHSGWPSEVDNDQLKGITEAVLLQGHKKLTKNSLLTFLWLFGI